MARANHTYTVHYIMHSYETAQRIDVLAHTKEEAYDIAVFEKIPQTHEGKLPYSAWVDSVTYDNGNCHYFNTSSGLPY